MRLFATPAVVTWSDAIKFDNEEPFYRCFDKNGCLSGHVRTIGQSNFLYKATQRKKGYPDDTRDLGLYDTVENAKKAVESAL